jgi:transcription initiation factor IIE alpha subunit
MPGKEEGAGMIELTALDRLREKRSQLADELKTLDQEIKKLLSEDYEKELVYHAVPIFNASNGPISGTSEWTAQGISAKTGLPIETVRKNLHILWNRREIIRADAVRLERPGWVSTYFKNYDGKHLKGFSGCPTRSYGLDGRPFIFGKCMCNQDAERGY